MREDGSQVSIFFQPFDLGSCVSIDDICLIILKAPWDDNKDVSFADPDLLFDLSFNPAHAGYTIYTFNPDVVRSHHQFCIAKCLMVSFIWYLNTDNLVRTSCAALVSAIVVIFA